MSYKSTKYILPKVIEVLPKVDSVVDFGPGSGFWLHAAHELGIKKLQGFGLPYTVEIPRELQDYVDPKPCLCDPWFTEANFNKPVKTSEKYDLVLCLEVAEHIPVEHEDVLLKSLTNAGDFILFSAAIPYQWGEGHVNIHWPSYWNKKFNDLGYKAADFLRYQLWDFTQEEIELHYKQNMILFVKENRYGELTLTEFDYSKVLNLPHPYIYCVLHGETYDDPNRKY
jgi:hypothetical protein